MANASEKFINEDLIIMPGTGATMSVGSDSYPYYVVELCKNNVIGLYQPKSWFDDKHPMEGGTRTVEKFDPSHEVDTYIKRFYGKWWTCDKSGKRIKRFTSKWQRLSFGHAYSYYDPSF